MKTHRTIAGWLVLLVLSILNLQLSTVFAQPVTQIATGSQSSRSFFLKSDGSLWGMGYNGDYGLGDATHTNSNIPKQIVASNVTAVAAGWSHSLFLKNDGSLWAVGSNLYGQLGDGNNPTCINPKQILANNVTTIAAGYGHSLFLKSDGSLWAMGYNYYGQLGDGYANIWPIYYETNQPEQILTSMANWEMALSIPTAGQNKLWPAMSLQLPQEASIVCFSRTTAACGPWGEMTLASWATALTT